MSSTSQENKIKDLKSFILQSKEIDKATKMICFALIDSSNFFTEPVYFVFNLLNIIDNRRLGTEIIKKQLDQIIIETGFQFFYMEEMENYRSIFCLSRVPFDCKAKEITQKFVENTKLELI